MIEDSPSKVESAKRDPRAQEDDALSEEASEPPSPAVSVAPAADRWVKVWDVPARAFHWLLVSLVALNIFTGFVTPEWWLGVHNWVGYGLVALMLFRLVWGICGSEYSRVTSFIYPPRDTVEHLRGLLLLRPPHYVGHNPTGALMVFALAVVLTALVVTGLLVLGGEEKQGPLAAVIGYSVASAAKQIHHWLTLLLLVMISAHIAGVVTESVLTHDNLVCAIITGWKQLPPAAPVPTPRAARPVLAIALFVVVAGGAVATLDWFSRRPPPLSLRALPENATYQKECGACHYALNPSLLPASSWAALMTSLHEHFGEDASLDASTTTRLAAWLVSNAAETFDTESANRFRIVAPHDPYRVTATPYWVRKHASVSPDAFGRKSVRSKVNCDACHRDAASGRFDDQAIAIPEEQKAMKGSHVLMVLLISVGLVAGANAAADSRRDAILAELLAQARKVDPGFAGFSAERGAAFYRATHTGGKQGTASCASCHGSTPQGQGQTRAGKAIEPMAVSKNPARYTNKDDVEKWFTRNCNDVLGRACTAKEKGDFITFMMGQ